MACFGAVGQWVRKSRASHLRFKRKTQPALYGGPFRSRRRKRMPESTLCQTARVAVLALTSLVPALCHADGFGQHEHAQRSRIQVGERPYYLVSKMRPGPLKEKLERCGDGPFFKTDFSIGHRGGGTLQFPEHTRESHEAGARMGAGIQECDVTFTRDGQLVCRHDQCDLHTTTDILAKPLAAKCTQPFTPAVLDDAGKVVTPAAALCCTSDLTLEEFKTLKGKMDASNPNATTPEAFLGGTPNYRTDLYNTGGTLLTHKESIALIRKLVASSRPS
jgi:glycerophosphoryl diester phosphodiesterase